MANLKTGNESICTNCKSMSDCAFKNNSKAAIMYCEEFECAGQQGSEKKKAAPDFNQYIIDAIDTSTGLCCNCDFKSDCLSNRNPGNILYCEEYACH